MGESETYLRDSLGSEADALQASHDYESGMELPGLSVAPLTPPAWWSRPVPDWPGEVCHVLEILHLDTVFATYPTLDMALLDGDHEPEQ